MHVSGTVLAVLGREVRVTDPPWLSYPILAAGPWSAIAARVAVRPVHTLNRFLAALLDDRNEIIVRSEVARVRDLHAGTSDELVDLTSCPIDQPSGREEPEEQGDALVAEPRHPLECFRHRRPSHAR